jgi:4-hydroxybenzoate polyprenyltransferase
VRLPALVRLSRPFTLLAPAIGMVGAACAALGFPNVVSGEAFALPSWALGKIAIGGLGAALLNVASNTVNQIYDIEVDRINKPDRPLPAGEISLGQAWVVTVVTYLLALGCAWLVNELLLVIVAFTVFLTYAYSGPPFRTKRHWAFANITIAIPRGFLLPLAGWATVWGSAEFAAVGDALPSDIWTFAAASGAFVLGAASTKDFADLAGDEAGGCITLPLRVGVEKAVKIIAPFLFIPWLLFPIGVALGWLSGNAAILAGGGALLIVMGARAAWLLVTRPEALTDQSTHPAWVLMYLMMVLSQVVFALGYVFAPGAAA